MNKYPLTIENDWDLLYKKYPEIYDEFASISKKPKWINIAKEMFDLKDKIIVDMGSGSGKSTFSLTKYAKAVIGIEPEDSMRKLAIKNAKKKCIKNISFKKGWAHQIPLDRNSVDILIGVTAPPLYKKRDIKSFVKEASRIVKSGGHIITVDIAPKWYGGELAPVILGKSRVTKEDAEGVVDKVLNELGFKHKDFFSIQDFKSVEKAIKTYGFIFGKKAIDFLRKHNKPTIKWKLRIHYKEV